MSEEVIVIAGDGEPVRYKDIEGFPGYRVGSDGSVWSCRLKGARGGLSGQWKQLSIYRRPYGSRYCIVCMRAETNGKVSARYVHRLVLTTFIGPCPEGMEACHNDGDTANNCLSNLRWDTHQANGADQVRHGTSRKGIRHHGAKITEEDVRRIFELRATGLSQAKIGRIVGLGQTSVGRILRCKGWSHVEINLESQS